MNVQSIPKITPKQTEILDLIYTHRFLTRIQIQSFLKHKDKKTINLCLKDLRQKEYIHWIYNNHHFAEKTKPAIYYMGINGIRHLHNMGFHEDKEINKRYREHKRSQGFIDRSLAIADVCITLDAARTVDNVGTYLEPGISYFYETEADYKSESYYHFLSDNELIRPNLCFHKAIHEGHEESKVVNSYLLEIFDSTLPRYRLRNRLKKYVEYLDEEMDEWEEQTYGDPQPTISLICATLTDLIYAKRRTRGLMADIWEYEDEDRPRISFTTIQKLKESGVIAEEIWEEV